MVEPKVENKDTDASEKKQLRRWWNKSKKKRGMDTHNETRKEKFDGAWDDMMEAICLCHW